MTKDEIEAITQRALAKAQAGKLSSRPLSDAEMARIEELKRRAKALSELAELDGEHL